MQILKQCEWNIIDLPKSYDFIFHLVPSLRFLNLLVYYHNIFCIDNNRHNLDCWLHGVNTKQCDIFLQSKSGKRQFKEIIKKCTGFERATLMQKFEQYEKDKRFENKPEK